MSVVVSMLDTFPEFSLKRFFEPCFSLVFDYIAQVVLIGEVHAGFV